MTPRAARYLVQVCLGHGWGGPHLYLIRIAKEARRRGYEPVIVASPGSPLASGARRRGLEVMSIPEGDRSCFWRKVIQKTKGRQISSVHLHSIRGLPRGFVSLPPDIQLVLTEHSYRFREVLHPLSRMALSRVDVVLATSRALAEVNGRALGVNPERTRVLHHGVNLTRFHPESNAQGRRKARERFELDPEDRVLLVPTTFRKEKNLDTSIELMALLRERFPDVRMLMTGNYSFDANSKETRRELERRILHHGLRGRVHLTGYLERMEDAYAAADIVCVPSQHEAFGLPAIEAMGVGLPVVGSREGAFPEIVEDGVSGVCIDSRSAQAWCDALAPLLEDPEAAARMGRAGRQRAEERFDLFDHWTRLFDLYDEGRAPRAPKAPQVMGF